MLLKVVLFLIVVLITQTVPTLANNEISASFENENDGKIIGFVSGRVVGGTNAIPHEFPYQITMQWNFFPFIPSLSRTQHMCGGSILNERYILTAAHCISVAPPLGRLEIFAGRHDFRQNEVATQQWVLIEQPFLYPAYMGGTDPHDIAVIKLQTALIFNQYVQPIKLPKANTVSTGIATASGWGSMSMTTTPNPAQILQKVDLPVLDWTVCDNVLRSIGVTSLGRTNVCTGPLTGGIGICSGDSGGPLAQINDDNETVVIGVVSWSFVPCGFPNRPNVYAQVSNYIDWINSIVKW